MEKRGVRIILYETTFHETGITQEQVKSLFINLQHDVDELNAKYNAMTPVSLVGSGVWGAVGGAGGAMVACREAFYLELFFREWV